METVDCNLCGSRKQRVVYTKPDAHYFRDEWFTIVECLECGLGFVNPRPDAVEISRFYPPEYFNYDELDAAYHRRRYELQAQLVADQIQNAGGRQLLDVGCANGSFARRMQELGWQVEGVEVSANSRTIDDFKVYHQSFPEIPVHQPRYDAITAWAVLEHVHDPMAYFRKVGITLKPEGIFVFLVTNFASLSSRALFREDVPRHLYFFTEHTVREYLAQAGMTLIRATYNKDLLSEMRPVGWLRYYLWRAAGKKMEWQDLPPNRVEYFGQRRLENTPVSTARYVIANPLAAIDRLLMPLYEQMQILNDSYGIVTYVAVKRH